MIVDNVIIINKEPEFENCTKLDASVAYFVVCKKGEHKIGKKDVYLHEIAGEKIVDWVARACEKPKILEINDYQNELNAVLPNLTESEYTVILKGNIPLITKQHLKNVLNYVMRKHMNACKLKNCGYVFNTEYLKDVGKILSADCYNLSSNDFFEVTDFDSLCEAKCEIAKRIYDYHSKNGVTFESFYPESISANVQIGYGTMVKQGAKILSGTKILNDVYIGENSLIYNSMLNDDCAISKNVLIDCSIIGGNCKISDSAFIKNCKIGDGVTIGSGVSLENCEVFKGCVIGAFSKLYGSKIRENVKIGHMSKIDACEILENVEILDGKTLINNGEKR